MKEFFPVLHTASLFSGISDEELAAMLSCLGARIGTFPKGSHLLRAGDTVEEVGLVLTGSALIVQEDIWGNRNILSKAGPGQTFAEVFACAPGGGTERERGGGERGDGDVFARKTRFERVPLRLLPSRSHRPQPAGRAGGEEPASQRKTHPHGPAHDASKADVLFFRRGAAPGRL